MNIRINKPTPRGIIVSALEVIELVFGVVIVAAVEEGIELGVGNIGCRNVRGGACVGSAADSAPGIVGIACNRLAVVGQHRHLMLTAGADSNDDHSSSTTMSILARAVLAVYRTADSSGISTGAGAGAAAEASSFSLAMAAITSASTSCCRSGLAFK